METSVSEPATQASGRSQVEERVAGKVEESLRSAKRAFEKSDFSAALRAIEKVPDGHRTAEMKKLYESCEQLQNLQSLFQSVEKCFSKGEHAEAVRILEQLPEAARNEKSNELLNKAQMFVKTKPVIEAAQRRLAAHDYAEVIQVLEEIPKPYRSDDLVAMLQEAHTKQRRLKELRSEVDKVLANAGEKDSAEPYIESIPLLQQILELKPNDVDASRQTKEAERFRELYERRDYLYESAVDLFENRDYPSAIRLLDQVDAQLRTGQVAELQQRTQECLQKIEKLTAEILTCIREKQFNAIHDKLLELDTLLPQADEQIIGSLDDEEYEALLTSLSEQSETEPNLILTLDRLVEATQPGRFIPMMANSNEPFLVCYPDSALALPTKLSEILDHLPTHPEQIELHLTALRAARTHLREDVIRLDAWDECLKALDEFDELQNQPWSWKERLVENAKASQLEEVARRLAQNADLILPADEDPWLLLKQIADGRLESSNKLIQRVHAKISDYLRTAEWSSEPITPITLRRVGQMMAWGTGIALVGLGVQLLLSLLFDVGGTTGYLLVVFLVALWTFFCRTLNKLL